jgi:phosphate transport system permease protein
MSKAGSPSRLTFVRTERDAVDRDRPESCGPATDVPEPEQVADPLAAGPEVVAPDASPAPRTRTPRRIVEVPGRADKIFDRLTLSSGLIVLLLLTLVGFFLLFQSHEALGQSGLSFFTRTEWRTDVQPARIGVLGLLVGTVLVALIAVIIAVPLGVVVALFITEYSSARTRKWLTGLIDLLAAIPSLLFGIWGFLFLSAQIVPLSQWLTDHLGFIPFFATDPGALLTGSMFIAGIVVSLMVLPIIAAVVREVFSQVPPGEKEAALALGSTRWGMIRAVVLPFGRGGIIGGSMLGLGRALGETIAVTLLLPQVPQVSIQILQNGGATVSGFIANRAGSDAFTVSGLMAAGLVLFVITLATNMIASVVVSKSRSGAGVEL